jgi:hypothetical protein
MIRNEYNGDNIGGSQTIGFSARSRAEVYAVKFVL